MVLFSRWSTFDTYVFKGGGWMGSFFIVCGVTFWEKYSYDKIFIISYDWDTDCNWSSRYIVISAISEF